MANLKKSRDAKQGLIISIFGATEKTVSKTTLPIISESNDSGILIFASTWLLLWVELAIMVTWNAGGPLASHN